MSRYAILTNEPERLRQIYADRGVSVTAFKTAVDALVWERRQRREGVIVLESRGWLFGVEFEQTRERGDGDGDARDRAAS